MSLYGYVRGTHLKPNMRVHIPGVGDMSVAEISLLPDPCPLPDKIKKVCFGVLVYVCVSVQMQRLFSYAVMRAPVRTPARAAQGKLHDKQGDG